MNRPIHGVLLVITKNPDMSQLSWNGITLVFLTRNGPKNISIIFSALLTHTMNLWVLYGTIQLLFRNFSNMRTMRLALKNILHIYILTKEKGLARFLFMAMMLKFLTLDRGGIKR